MPTTFLALTNRLLKRVNEVEIDQADFATVRGVQAFAKDAINASIEEINQQDFEWPFNAETAGQSLTIGQPTYDFFANHKVVEWESFRLQNNSTFGNNTSKLTLITKEEWYNYLMERDGDTESAATGYAKPRYVYPISAYGYGVSPLPDHGYLLFYDYYKNPVRLDLFDDESTVPSVYDEVIIEGALYHFYTFRDNTAQAQITQRKFQTRLGSMRTQLINKYDRMTSHMIVRDNWRGAFSDRVY